MENLNEHRKGLLGKTVPIGNMLTWTKASKHSSCCLLFFTLAINSFTSLLSFCILCTFYVLFVGESIILTCLNVGLKQHFSAACSPVTV